MSYPITKKEADILDEFVDSLEELNDLEYTDREYLRWCHDMTENDEE